MLSRAPDRARIAVNRKFRRAAFAWLTGGALWFVLEAIAAAAFPHYDYARFYISDLGNPLREYFDGRAIDSRLSWVLDADLVLHGTAFVAGTVFAARAVKNGTARYAFVALATCNLLGGIVVATFHSSSLAVANGTERLHELGALVSIVGGDVAIVTAGAFAKKFGASTPYRASSIAAGAAGIASLALLVANPPFVRSLPGLYERGAVYPIMLWEIATALAILRIRQRADTKS